MKQEQIILPSWLQNRFIVLIGLMGAGKTRLGRILAESLKLPFIDTDIEIEKAAGITIEEIFNNFGETYFRNGEQKVINRVLNGEPSILATGGGAFMNSVTRKKIEKFGISIWLRADINLLVKRTGSRSGRPLLKNGNRREILSKLMKERYPVYSEADIVFNISDEPASETAKKLIEILNTTKSVHKRSDANNYG